MVKEVPRTTLVVKGYQYNSLKTVIYSDGAYKSTYLGAIHLV